ncbi:MAG: TlyA family RNA methyltransferase [Ilumatobacteraceae bacterium]
MRVRLDAAMVRRGLAHSRSEACGLIDERLVTVAGVIAEKASRLVADSEPIEIIRQRRFVSRGGEKLEGGLLRLGVAVEGRSVLDAGASTGGFTDCLLSRGARRVFAVDVGRNQLHERISSDPRVVSREQVNVRDLGPSDMPFPVSLVVADLSFISLVTVLPALVGLVSPEDGFPVAEMVLLVKPQFEVGRVEASRGRGVITDPHLHESAVAQVADEVRRLGWTVEGTVESPLKGQDGNTEFLLHASAPVRP